MPTFLKIQYSVVYFVYTTYATFLKTVTSSFKTDNLRFKLNLQVGCYYIFRLLTATKAGH